MDLSRTQALSGLISNLGNIDFSAFNFGNNSTPIGNFEKAYSSYEDFLLDQPGGLPEVTVTR